MPDTTPKVQPPKPQKTGGNGQAKKTPSGPSPHVRESYIKKVKEIIKKKQGGS